MYPLLNDIEKIIIKTLGEAFNQYNDLEELHPSDRSEFIHAIHMAQNIIMSRAVLRDQGNNLKTTDGN